MILNLSNLSNKNLTKIPNTLKYLFLENNQITKIPEKLPNTLIILNLENYV